MSRRYIPKPVPNTEDAKVLATFLREELQIISNVIADNIEVNFNVVDVEPEKRVNGMVRFADGINWNPGTGPGLYLRIGGAWVEL